MTEYEWLASGSPGYSVSRSWRGYCLHFSMMNGKYRAFYGTTPREQIYGGQGATKREALRKVRAAVNKVADERDLFLTFATRKWHESDEKLLLGRDKQAT